MLTLVENGIKQGYIKQEFYNELFEYYRKTYKITDKNFERRRFN